MANAVLDKLNQSCAEVGICEPAIKHAAELFKDDSGRVIRVACFEDGMVTSCVVELGKGKAEEKTCCYTAEKGGNELYFAWIAHLCSPEVGYKEKRVEAE